MKKIFAIFTTLLLMVSIMVPAQASTGTPTKAINEKLGVPIVVYGANLSEAEREQMKKALGVDQEPEFDEVTVSGQDLAKYVKNSNPNSRMYSSAKITRQEEGEGLIINIVTPENITQVTAEMYANAMLTAGIKDAIVDVAGPKPVTGHSALVGIYKAYEVKTGETLDPERTDVASDELSVATTLAENSNISDEQVANLLTEIKKAIAEQSPATKEEVQQIVEEQLSKLEINLSETDRQLLIDLMDKIRQLNIDFSQWSDQLADISTTLQDKFGEIGNLMQDEGFWQSVKNFFQNIMDTISSWFGSSDSEPETQP